MRASTQIITINPTAGINESVDEAQMNQCAPGTVNVWAPAGRIENRPGYVGVYLVSANTFTETTEIEEWYFGDTSAGTTVATDDITNAVAKTNGQAGDYIYLGSASTFDFVEVDIDTASTRNMIYRAEYWNGSSWQKLNGIRLQANSVSEERYLFTANTEIKLVPPKDWSTTTIDGDNLYFIRLLLIGSGHTTGFSIVGPITIQYDNFDSEVYGFFRPEFSGNKRYIILHKEPSEYKQTSIPKLGQVSFSDSSVKNAFSFSTGVASVREEPATIAVVPDFDECFVAYNHAVVRHTAFEMSSGAYAEFAQVEDRDFAVGTGAPLDRNIVALINEWPKASYIHFFKNKIWMTGILGEPNLIRWTAASPYHKVLPALNFERVGTTDTVTTGVNHLGEHMVVFTRDSIAIMVETGISQFNLETYVVQEVVSGVGCVANSSVQHVNGRLIFLAEDGIYSFDGTPNVRKVTIDPATGADRLIETMSKISKAKRKFCASVVWKKYSCYLLSFSTGIDATNDTTVVWDYARNRWWVWEGIDAQHWLADETGSDSEVLMFGDSNGYIYQLEAGQTDDGRTIESTFVTQRIEHDDAVRVTSIEVTATNKTRSLDVSVLKNDAESGTVQEFSYTDYNEADWTDFSYTSGASTDDNWVSSRRRIDRHDFIEEGDWVQIKVSHDEKYQKMSVSGVKVGLIPIGGR